MDERIQSALNYIEQNIGSSISLADISKVVYLSPYHLHRLFKAETGVALKKFMDMLKMEKAYQYVVDEEKKVKDISNELGYHDYETFSRAFKRYHQVAPDILRAISIKLHQQIKGLQEHGNIIVVTNETADKKEISDKIKSKLADSGISISNSTQIKTYVMHRLSDSSDNTPDMIRNKYSIQKGGKAWEIVLNKLKTERSKKKK